MDSAARFMESVEKINEQLAQYDSLLAAQDLQNFKNLARNLKEALREEKNKGKILRLGIIGSVKAGKSSFLNALLFNGEEVLPKAATPMTASLTKLAFSENQFLNFVFYSPEDWQIIKAEHRTVANRLAQEVKEAEKREEDLRRRSPHYYMPQRIDKDKIYESLDVPETQKACYDLVEQAKKNKLDCSSLFGTSKTKEITSLSEVCDSLGQYVGKDGTYSPIVKYVEMGINNSALQNLEIVDTPGLNDPIRSRSEETYKFMCQCDAVFLLSRASQFLTNDDMDLFRRTLVDSGISTEAISLIATQIDLGAQNERGKTPSYKEAIQRTLKTVFNTAKRASVPHAPIPVCSIFEIMACKKENRKSLGKDEQQIEKNLACFEEDVPVTSAEFRDYSNMQAVYDELKKYRQNKDRIIEEHQKALARESRRKFLEILTALTKGVDANIRMLKEHDMASLTSLRDELLALMDAVSLPISNVFSRMENEIGQKFADLKNRILTNSKNFEYIEVDVSTYQGDMFRTEGRWWWKKTIKDTVNITTHTAQLAQALQQLRKYAAKCEEDVNDTIKELVDKDALNESLKRIVLPFYRKFETDNVRLPMNEDMILLPINALVQEFNIPQWHFDNSPYNSALQRSYDKKIENEEIYGFKTAFELQLQALCQDMRKNLDEKRDQMSDKLAHAAVNFADEVRHLLEEQMAKLMEQMNDKQEGLKRYGECRNSLEQCKKMLVE